MACLQPSGAAAPNALILQLQIALNMILPIEKADYLLALQVAPDLVLTESDPMRFIRFTSLDYTVAAKMLVNYWKRRREIFGDRAFLPMILTGGGAVSEHAIAFMKTGQVSYLPNDLAGGTIMCFDNSRRIEDTINVRFEVAFYHGQHISENAASQTQGFTVISLFSDPRNDEGSALCHDIFFNTFPNKIKSVHIFDCIPRWDSSSSEENGGFNPSKLESVYGHLLSKFPIILHGSRGKDDWVREMLQYGISKESLPKSIGGEWDYESFMDWFNFRAKLDKARYPNIRRVDTKLASPNEGADSENNIEKVYQSFNTQLEKVLQSPEFEAAMKNYKEAVANAPESVWQTECCIDSFLRIEHYHAWLTAKRIGRYWDLRAETFGTKMFLNLYQTGEDALGRNELSLLGTGFLNLIPNDSDGRPVLFVDATSLPRGPIGEARNRCFFYMFSLLCENSQAQNEGAILILRMGTPQLYQIELSFIERLVDSFPLRFKDVHLVSDNDMFPADAASHITFSDKTYLHNGSNKQELLSKLQAFGMKVSGIPKSLGGEWGYSKFIQWQELRTRMEWRIPPGVVGRENANADDFPAIAPYKVLPECDVAERKRRLNVINCRRKRDRVRVEMDLLQEQCGELRAEQAKFREEGDRLEKLLALAQNMIKSGGPTECSRAVAGNATALVSSS